MKSLLLLIFVISSVYSFSVQQNQEYKLKIKPGGRIINGVPAVDTEFPYMAAIWTTTSVGRYFCGGSVIDREWILTAGSCILDAVSSLIQLGSISLTNSSSNRITTTATTFFIHPDFDSDTLINNIGLIQLPESLRLNDYVNIIELPTSVLLEDTPLTSIGWGQIDDEHSGPVDILHKVSVKSFLNEHCQNIYGDQITESMVCAMGSYNEGTCIGDIGGPLIHSDENQTAVVGVASFLSFNGCESLDPSGYERTFSHLEWIKNITGIA